MSELENVELPTVPAVKIALDPAGSLTLTGEISTRDPAEAMSPFLQRIHRAIIADRLKVFTLNVAQLTFVNSSAIRLFVNWVTWARQEAEDTHYDLIIEMDQNITWQKTSLVAIKALASGTVSLHPVG